MTNEVWILVDIETGHIRVEQASLIGMQSADFLKRFNPECSFSISCGRIAPDRIQGLLLDWFHEYRLMDRPKSESEHWLSGFALTDILAFIKEHGTRLELARMVWSSVSTQTRATDIKPSHRLIPMLSVPKVYRRHTGACIAKRSFHDKQFIRCDCMIHIEGRISPGNSVRESLHTRDWAKAQRIIASAKQVGFWAKRGVLTAGLISVKAAIERFLTGYKGRDQRGLKQVTKDRYRTTLLRFSDYLDYQGDYPIRELPNSVVENFVMSQSKGNQSNTNLKNSLRAFFGFCAEQEWIASLPRSSLMYGLKQESQIIRSSFSDEEVHNLLETSRRISRESYAFLLVLLNTGLWISDAVMLRKSDIHDDTLVVTKIKGGNLLRIPLSSHVQAELSSITPTREDFLFLHGDSKRLATVTDLWRRKLNIIGHRANVRDADPSRFRHTFAVALFRSDTNLATISYLLGHASPAVTAKVYETEFKAAIERQSSRLTETLKIAIARASWQSGIGLTLINKVDSATTANEKGKALEELCRRLFETIPGFEVKERVSNGTEEFDLVIHNSNDEGYLGKEQFVILVECKNWSSSCGKDEYVILFDKVRNRNHRCSLAFLISWNGFKSTLKETERRNSRDEVLIVPISGQAIRQAVGKSSFGDLLLTSYEQTALG